MNNPLYFHRFLQNSIIFILVASIFFPSNLLEKSVFEEIKCKNGNNYGFRPFDLPEKDFAWINCEAGLQLEVIEIKSGKTGLIPADEFNPDEYEAIGQDILSKIMNYEVIKRGVDAKRFIELFSSRLPVVAIVVSAIAFLGALVVPARKTIKQHGETSELVTAISSALLIGGILVVAIVWGYKTWLSWLEPKISDFRLWRSTFFSQNIYWIKPLGLSMGILIASLVTAEFIENVKIKGFKQAWKDTCAENRQDGQEKRIELPPFKLSSLKETWSGKFVIVMAITLIGMIVISVIVSLIANS